MSNDSGSRIEFREWQTPSAESPMVRLKIAKLQTQNRWTAVILVLAVLAIVILAIRDTQRSSQVSSLIRASERRQSTEVVVQARRFVVADELGERIGHRDRFYEG